MAPGYEVLGQLVDVILHSPHVGEEEICYHAVGKRVTAAVVINTTRE